MKYPGFVDLQVNGYIGTAFAIPGLKEDDFVRSCRALLEQGTAAFLVTVPTSPLEVYQRNLPLIAKAMGQPEFKGRLLGLHLEGPFLCKEPGAVGAHPPECVRAPDPDFLDRLQELSGGMVRLLTLAAELEGAEKLTRHAVSKGITVSLGHQLATESDLARLTDAGATALTHLGNGLPNMIHRHTNPIWPALAEDRLTAMIITDGHHLPRPLIKTVVRAKGVAKTVVVSDASELAGMPPGRYTSLGNDCILEESGLIHNPVKQCLVGSSATMLRCMNVLASMGILSLDELLAVGFHNPLRLIGLRPEDVRPVRPVTYDEKKRTFAV